MQNAAQTIETMARLRAMGVLIYMDDFGTGYSSLSQLQRMPLDALKIDRAFVKDMSHDETGSSIVESIIALAHTMGLRVIAEGVETADQASRLAASRLRLPAGLPLRPPHAGRARRGLRRAPRGAQAFPGGRALDRRLVRPRQALQQVAPGTSSGDVQSDNLRELDDCDVRGIRLQVFSRT